MMPKTTILEVETALLWDAKRANFTFLGDGLI